MFYFSPQVTPLQTKIFALSTGIFYLSNFNGETSNAVGIAYGVGTFGNENSSLTLGLGYGFLGDNFYNKPILIAGAQTKIFKGCNLMGEFWIPTENGIPIIFVGFRVFNNAITGDIAIARPLNLPGKGFPFLPWVSITYTFDFVKKD